MVDFAANYGARKQISHLQKFFTYIFNMNMKNNENPIALNNKIEP